MSEPGFVVGGRYENTAGEYEVLAIDAGTVRIRYTNGFQMTLPAQGLWAQYESLVAERTGRTTAPSRPAAPSRTSSAAERAPTARAATPRAEVPARTPKPKRSEIAGEPGFYIAVGYLAAGCEVRASVPGRDYAGFAQRYKLHTGRSLITPHAGLEVHERPTHRMGADLSVRFPASPGALGWFDFGPGAKPELDSDGQYVVTKTDVVERLLKLGFDLGMNNDPVSVRMKVPPPHVFHFDRGIALRQAAKRA